MSAKRVSDEQVAAVLASAEHADGSDVGIHWADNRLLCPHWTDEFEIMHALAADLRDCRATLAEATNLRDQYKARALAAEEGERTLEAVRAELAEADANAHQWHAQADLATKALAASQARVAQLEAALRAGDGMIRKLLAGKVTDLDTENVAHAIAAALSAPSPQGEKP